MKREDLAMHQGLMKLLNEGTFELKAREVPAFMKIYEWAKDLPQLMKEQPKSLPPSPKPIRKKKS